MLDSANLKQIRGLIRNSPGRLEREDKCLNNLLGLIDTMVNRNILVFEMCFDTRRFFFFLGCFHEKKVIVEEANQPLTLGFTFYFLIQLSVEALLIFLS